MPIARCVSYPKSGRTWLRRMLEVADVRDIEFQHDGFEFNDGAKPPHDFRIEERLAQYGAGDRVIYLDRDPRDVMVSLYHQVTGRFRDFYNYPGTISEFIRDPYFGADVLARFRAVWAEVLAQRDFLRVSYEELHADSKQTLARVLSYIDVDREAATLTAAVEAGRFDSMRELEASGQHPEPWMRPREGFPKVRRGEIGGHQRELAQDDQDYLNTVFAP